MQTKKQSPVKEGSETSKSKAPRTRQTPLKQKSRSFLGSTIKMVLRSVLVGLVVFIGAGYFKYQEEMEFSAVNNEQCRVMRGYRGLEDVQFSIDWPGVLFATSDPKEYQFVQSKIKPDIPQGKLLRVDFSQPEPKFEEVTLYMYPHKEFHPHGMHLLDKSRNPSDMSGRLLVVNHRADEEAIESFGAMGKDGKRWVWTKSLTHKLFTGINDLVIIDINTVYVTNFLAAPLKYGLIEDLLLRLPAKPLQAKHNVVYCNNILADDLNCKVVLDNIDANGITANFEGTRMYIRAGLTDVRVYAILKGGALSFLHTVLRTPTDNINMDPDGNLYLAGARGLVRPLLYLLQTSLFGSSNISVPSQVSRLDTISKKATEEKLYVGTHLSLLSSADMWNGQLVAGSVYDDGLLVCNLNKA
eukprot:gb/GEZN01005879.1/.p1 GENE.gb/GEZN01005879.1/~~gb/GEZN01005879.1/.p1  ORF type:complete len:413 (+),score=49.27 gb/GEZN01005879.1/:103-1341(+)